MSEPSDSRTRRWSGLLGIVILAAVVYLIVRNFGVFTNFAIVIVGFGAVVLVHEFGHFIVAKIGGIKVEAFSIFMPPTVVGLRRTKEGLKLRILPRVFAKDDDAEGGREWSYVFGKKGKEWETEYRIGLIPFGGYVKMLGQEDVGPIKAINDPRSYANKPVSVRIPVIAAGVTFNVISAAIILVAVFLIGIGLPPAVVGGVVSGSPAAEAGLKAGDEIIEIAGKSKNLDFTVVALSAALAKADERIPVRVRRRDGSEQTIRLAAEKPPDSSIREFGILPPESLTIASVTDPGKLLENTGLMPGDRIRSVNGTAVETHWDLGAIIEDILAPKAKLIAERVKDDGGTELIETSIRLELGLVQRQYESENELQHIYSMVPRLRVVSVGSSTRHGLEGRERHGQDGRATLWAGDIILAAGGIPNPTYIELRQITIEHEGRDLPIRVLRKDEQGAEQIGDVTVVPRRKAGEEQAKIGIAIVFDAAHAVVAKTIAAEGGPEPLAIPRGARVTAIDGQAVSSFYDCIRLIRESAGKRVTISYVTDDDTIGGVAVDLDPDNDHIAVVSTLTESLPFEPLTRLYRASSPIEALGMGYRRTVLFIAQTYVTLQRLISGLLSPKLLMGPVGIIAFSYRVVSEQPLIYYAYLLGLISASIAVINLLPVLPFDGGHIVLMVIEKIRGTALSERTQGVLSYAGVVLVLALFLYVTFNDIMRNFFAPDWFR